MCLEAAVKKDKSSSFIPGCCVMIENFKRSKTANLKEFYKSKSEFRNGVLWLD